MFKRLLATFLCTMMMTSMTACNQTAVEKTEVVPEATEATTEEQMPTHYLNVNAESRLIYCITPKTTNPYFKAMQDAAKDKGAELSYTVKCYSHDDDSQKQAELFEQAIEEKASFIVCDNAGTQISAAEVQKAYDAGIGVFLVDRGINQEGIAAAQIICDNEQAAKEVADYLVKQTGGTGKYAELKGKESDNNSKIRSDAFHEIIDHTEMEMVDNPTANWDKAEAKKQTAKILKKYPDIVALVCGNDEMACGAVEAVKAANVDHDIYIIGIDGSNEMRDNIENGLATATMLQPIDEMTRMAIEQGDTLMMAKYTGKDEMQTIECQLIDIENADKLDNFVYSK